ncbi:MAG: DnaD domain protein [Ruminococcaceae bacterium]|nr:DnaD domain protein [Oscillospiraceae bacterium]
MKNVYLINFGSAVTVLPASAAEKIVGGQATLTDVRALTALLSLPDGNEKTAGAVSALTGLSEDVCESSLAFWRGAGVISIADTVANDAPQQPSFEPAADETEAKPAKAVKAAKAAETAKSAEIEKKDKKLLSNDLPKYSGIQISELLEKDGGKLRNMIDVCQQFIGHILNPNEINTMVGLCDWLGLDAEFVITLCAYYTGKKPGCNVRYIERAAVDLVNSGIETPAQLESYLKDMELYDGLAGKLRSWLGIGTRAYTKKENGMIKRWVKDFGYGEDVVRLAYEITVDAKGSFNFDYAGKILENWFAAGVKTVEDAQARVNEFKSNKKSSNEQSSSFDIDELFDLAIQRSYKKMGDKK